MKNLIILIAALLIADLSFGQVKSSLTVFSKEGEKFWIIKNGIKQNKDPQTNVTLDNVTENTFKIKVMINDEKLTSVDQTIYRVDVDEKVCNLTYELKKSKKGEYKLGWPMYEAVSAQNPRSNTQVQEPVQTNSNTQVQQKPQTQGNSEQINMGLNVNINPNGLGMNTSTTVSTSTTSTQTQSGGVNINMNMDGDGDMEQPKDHVRPNQNQHHNQQRPPQPASGNCEGPMLPGDFAEAKQMVASESFSSDKMNVAKQFTEVNCLTVAQIKEVLSLFSYENDKLEYAKFAYKYTFEPKKYYLVNESFTYSSSKEELNQFIQANKK